MKSSIILSFMTVSFLFISGCSEDKVSNKEETSKPKEEAAKEEKKLKAQNWWELWRGLQQRRVWTICRVLPIRRRPKGSGTSQGKIK